MNSSNPDTYQRVKVSPPSLFERGDIEVNTRKSISFKNRQNFAKLFAPCRLGLPIEVDIFSQNLASHLITSRFQIDKLVFAIIITYGSGDYLPDDCRLPILFFPSSNRLDWHTRMRCMVKSQNGTRYTYCLF